MIRVRTRNSTYIVDRENRRWMRLSDFDIHESDNEWVDGGFTLNSIGGCAFAHFASDPSGRSGQWTSTITDIWEAD